MNSRFAELNDRFAEMDRRIGESTSDLKDIFQGEMRRMEEMMLAKFAELDTRLTRLEGRQS